MESLRYFGLSLALGILSVWASENFFWILPPDDLTLLSLAATVLAYSIACAVALSAVIWTGCGGWTGLFLGGSLMGYMVEGVVVGTIYQAVPFQLVWTPLAWHGLLTGAVVLGLGRCGKVLGPARMALIWLALGLAAGYWAQYGPSERTSMPPLWLVWIYLLGCGLLVPVVHMLLDRIGRLPKPPRWVLVIAPVLAGLVWLAQMVATLNPVYVVMPIMVGLFVWILARLGNRAGVLTLGAAVPVWQHFLFLITPLTVVILAPIGWSLGLGTLEANGVIALVTCGISLGWLCRLIWLAARSRILPQETSVL